MLKKKCRPVSLYYSLDENCYGAHYRFSYLRHLVNACEVKAGIDVIAGNTMTL